MIITLLRRASFHPYPSPNTLRSFTAATRPVLQKNDNLPQSYTHDTLLQNKKILIANRGEIAIRIARAVKSLGATSLSVCAFEDVESPHVEFADEHVVLEKGETAIAPYLDIERLTRVAIENDVDFVHPGMRCITCV